MKADELRAAIYSADDPPNGDVRPFDARLARAMLDWADLKPGDVDRDGYRSDAAFRKGLALIAALQEIACDE